MTPPSRTPCAHESDVVCQAGHVLVPAPPGVCRLWRILGMRARRPSRCYCLLENGRVCAHAVRYVSHVPITRPGSASSWCVHLLSRLVRCVDRPESLRAVAQPSSLLKSCVFGAISAIDLVSSKWPLRLAGRLCPCSGVWGA